MSCKLDLENKVFVDKKGDTYELSQRVLVPRTAGGYSPGWIVEMPKIYNDLTLCSVILEEESESPGMIKHKTLYYGELFPIEEGLQV